MLVIRRTHGCRPLTHILVLWQGLRKMGDEIPKSCKILYLGNLTQDIIRKEVEYLLKILLSASKKVKNYKMVSEKQEQQL